MPTYELALLARNNANVVGPLLLRTSKLIQNRGGVVIKVENFGQQELPHRARRHMEYFTHARRLGLQFTVGTEFIKSLQSALAANTDVIRYTFIKNSPVHKHEKKMFHRCKNLDRAKRMELLQKSKDA
ncbi:30S ribosomal protein S6 [Sphaeroforma arctica JP610]|uniref:30S ribosomal protein S6 n=1 Tax=Sphaeroforma arctica JP610 TaxID=667725 RepID=A0A0L0G9B3_9EUKA|nr:30S ribosomal protein S6 [Sphaeroforma arctica JP610]KNC85481.1 30S ribosomal protein S6 [Sphaeroforma arctica JP610]|eukprot:XP_014159383.1 30S ribosomal protein S6 [Sphaeroforma arctica JP610]